jgi:predicted ester cyclase
MLIKIEEVATYMNTQGMHSGPFFGIPASGKTVSLSSMRIDLFQDGKIAEHWSVADMAGLMQQLQS